MELLSSLNKLIMKASYTAGILVGNIVDEFKKGYKDSKKSKED